MAAVGGLGVPPGLLGPCGSQRCWHYHPRSCLRQLREPGAWLRLRVETQRDGAGGLWKGAAWGRVPEESRTAPALAPPGSAPSLPPLWPTSLRAASLGPGNPTISAALRALLPGSPGTLHSPGRPPCSVRLGSPYRSELLLQRGRGAHLALPGPAPDLGGQPWYPPLPRAAIALPVPAPRVDRGRPSGQGRARGWGSRGGPGPTPPPALEARRAGAGLGAGHRSPGKPSSM